jgi:hypothetical protein
MNYLLLGVDVLAIIGFSSAFYNSLKLAHISTLLSASGAIRSIALFTGVIWGVFLAFYSFSGIALIEQTSASLLAFMGGLFTALMISRSY